MGTCLCKETTDNEDYAGPVSETVCSAAGLVSQPEELESFLPARSGSMRWKFPSSTTVDKLVLETLSVVGSLVENEQEPPPAMLKLHAIADQEEGWIQVVTSMVNVIPIKAPLGPSVITLLLDDCPLPTKESVLKLSNIFNLSSENSISGRSSPTQQRNICIVLGCLAEKLAGPSSITILTKGTLDYLITNLSEGSHQAVILFSLIALEKFAQTTENKVTIKKRLQAEDKNPLLRLEKWVSSDHFVERQIGFCAQWCLDNLFLVDGRKFSYECVDTSGINVMLNVKDVSEYLKISPDGLEARCDAYSFESVRCTFQVDSGVWYYEVVIITSGVMQIGWATKDSTFLNHDGCGIGDDQYSLAYDGCRKLIWHNARSEAQNKRGWIPGDILGCLLDLNKPEMIFYLNGAFLRSCTHVFETARSGFFAAASFMSFQQCRFNFGSRPFEYPPARSFKSFNDYATLSPEEKIVLPRHIRLELLRKLSVREDSCTLCFDKKASIRLKPCGHSGFCSNCIKLLNECPMCRSDICDSIQDIT
ncbi:UNVERIFIED_CONTAM: hypothetical protein PYX00_001592 [Menopon gallinae]|uniref:RING finger and SPRY domain-containing protein 1 n=1 Tax=Menopon gallinae TaxID=328185 RepID=A0AAW2IFH3_9NEOP